MMAASIKNNLNIAKVSRDGNAKKLTNKNSRVITNTRCNPTFVHRNSVA